MALEMIHVAKSEWEGLHERIRAYEGLVDTLKVEAEYLRGQLADIPELIRAAEASDAKAVHAAMEAVALRSELDQLRKQMEKQIPDCRECNGSKAITLGEGVNVAAIPCPACGGL